MSQPEREISEAIIREELGRVLACHEFRSSKRSQDFLRYVVEHSLSGRTDQLKERTIGIEVFGRPTTYDPSEDATVRVKAGEVRKRLSLYYGGEGSKSRIRIELPAGAYTPDFHLHRAGTVEAGVEDPAGNGVEKKSRGWLRTALLTVAVLLAVLILMGVYWWIHPRSSNLTLERFWSPVVQGTTPISICAAFVPVYALSTDPPLQRPPVPEDFVKLTDQFVGGGDLVAVSRLSSMLTRMQRPFQVKIGDAVSFEDLRVSPTILVGYSYTHWMEISRQLRYFIDASRTPVGITDNGAPTRWVLPYLRPDRHTSEDYALVTRVFHPDTHAMLVEVAGITQYGTDAAADLVTNGDLLTDALRTARSDWPSKNLQIVLHVKVIAGVPASPTAVATYVW